MAEASVPDVGKRKKPKKGKNHPPKGIYEEVNVLVTGSGTNADQSDESAWWIAQALPNILATDQNHMSRIRITVCEEPVPPTYSAARTFLEDYLGSRPEITFMLVLHLCATVAPMSADGYKVQRYARRTQYEIADGDGSNQTEVNELAWQDRTTVEVLNVPKATGEVAIADATEVVVGLIYALIDSRRSRDGDFEDDHQSAQQYQHQQDGVLD